MPFDENSKIVTLDTEASLKLSGDLPIVFVKIKNVNDVYVVKDELGKQKLLPGIDEVIKQIDLESGKIIVNLIEGL